MASTLNLFALDRDFPASRQLQVVVEQQVGDNNKFENRLLVTDNKSHAKLEEIRELLADGLTTTPTITSMVQYPAENLFGDVHDTDSNSRMVYVLNVNTINIYYSDGSFANTNAVRVMGRLNVTPPTNDDELYIDFIDLPSGQVDVELFSFFPQANDGKRTHNVINLNVNGVGLVYLTTTPDDEGILVEDRSAIVSAQFLRSEPGGITGGGGDGLEPIPVTVNNAEPISVNVNNAGDTELKVSDGELLVEISRLRTAYGLTNNFIGQSYNLFCTLTASNTLFLWNPLARIDEDQDIINIIKINKIIIQSSFVLTNSINSIDVSIFNLDENTDIAREETANFNLLSTSGSGTEEEAIIRYSTDNEAFDDDTVISSTNYTSILYSGATTDNTDQLVKTKELNFNNMFLFLRGRQGIRFTPTGEVDGVNLLQYTIQFNEFAVNDISSFIPDFE
jgi:hypothetical protein